MFTIRLNNLRFFGYHGLYDEEKVLGNEFEMSIALRLAYTQKEHLSIDDTVNYAEVYEVVKEVFAQREDLLETICVNTSEAIAERFTQVRGITITLTKLQMPIAGFIGTAGVTFEKAYE